MPLLRSPDRDEPLDAANEHLLALLQESIVMQRDGAVILQNMRATRAMESDIASAIEARVKQEQLREEYRQFRESCTNDRTFFELAGGGTPDFKQWLEEYRDA